MGTEGVKDGKCPICGCTYSIQFLQIHAASCGDAESPLAGRQDKKRERRNRDGGMRQGRMKKRTDGGWMQKMLRNANASTGLLRKMRTDDNERGAPGFFVFEEAMDVELEAVLVSMAHEAAPPFTNWKHRFSKSYGPVFNVMRRSFDWKVKQYPLPDYATKIILPLVKNKIPMLRGFRPNQLATQLYDPRKQGVENVHILPHNDCENGELGPFIVGVSLNADCTMTLILNAKQSGLGRDVKRDVRLPRRSVYIMSGDALRIWRHGIFAGMTEGARYSLTFREVIIPDQNRSGIALPTQQTQGARDTIARREQRHQKGPTRKLKQCKLSSPNVLRGRVAKPGR